MSFTTYSAATRAEPHYGGGLPSQHVESWCEGWLFAQSPPNTAFDISPAAQVNPLLANARLFLACTYRSFCNYNHPPNADQPRTTSVSNRYDHAFRAKSNQTHETMEQVVDDFETSWTGAARPWFNSWYRILYPIFNSDGSLLDGFLGRVQRLLRLLHGNSPSLEGIAPSTEIAPMQVQETPIKTTASSAYLVPKTAKLLLVAARME
ncbi:MAG: hypothetical protein Q9172_006105 [Xanthocarpia lactea]